MNIFVSWSVDNKNDRFLKEKKKMQEKKNESDAEAMKWCGDHHTNTHTHTKSVKDTLSYLSIKLENFAFKIIAQNIQQHKMKSLKCC